MDGDLFLMESEMYEMEPAALDDGRWDDDEWVNQQAELSAAEEGIVG